MGTGLPMALGAALHDSGLPTVLVAGDGGIAMYLAEAKLAVQHKLPLLIVLMTDNAFGSIRTRAIKEADAKAAYHGRQELGPCLRFARHPGTRAENIDAVQDALAAWAPSSGPAFLEIRSIPTPMRRWSQGSVRVTPDSNMAPHILIIGSGSVGKRHARNLAALGCRISCVDPREDRRAELARKRRCRLACHRRGRARAGGFDGVVVASPTAYHPADTLRRSKRSCRCCWKSRLPKPPPRPRSCCGRNRHLRAGADGLHVALVAAAKAPARAARRGSAIGTLRHVQFHMSAHLADWHPWERYQDFFMASAAQGGGALLDESHWIDLMVWLFGMPQQLIGRVEKICDLEIDTDDNVDVLAFATRRLCASRCISISMAGRMRNSSALSAREARCSGRPILTHRDRPRPHRNGRRKPSTASAMTCSLPLPRNFST